MPSSTNANRSSATCESRAASAQTAVRRRLRQHRAAEAQHQAQIFEPRMQREQDVRAVVGAYSQIVEACQASPQERRRHLFPNFFNDGFNFDLVKIISWQYLRITQASFFNLSWFRNLRAINSPGRSK